MYEVIIIGGGPAGLTAALYLGRACRRVLLLDSGEPRNAASQGMHGFLSRDGMLPAEFRQISRKQLEAYPTVRVLNTVVVEVKRGENGFEVMTTNGTCHEARKLLLATGVRDELPEIAGFRKFWGKGVYHCPYCDGWEVHNQSLAVYGKGEDGFKRTRLLTGWSRTVTLYSEGPAELSEPQRQQLTAAGVTIYEEKILRLEGESRLERIVLESGKTVECQGLFARPAQQQPGKLAQSLGLTLTENQLVESNSGGRTTIPGLYVAGDSSAQAQQVVLAAASGALTTIHLNEELATEAFNNLNSSNATYRKFTRLERTVALMPQFRTD